MRKATARPWEVKPSSHGKDHFIIAHRGECLLGTSAGIWPEEINRANADYVVRCVNLHDELVAGIKALPCFCEDSSDYGPQACERCKLLAKVER